MDVGGGVMLADKIQTEYTKLVDRNMCSVVCPCPLDVSDTWTSIPQEKLRSYGRIALWSQATEEEAREVIEKGPYDANVTALNFATPNIRSYTQCYNENLKPLFE
jgi:hypothetical protein